MTKPKPRTSLACCAGLMLVAAGARADSFYCGQWIASPDMSVAELLEKCGEPTRKESQSVDIRARSDGGRGSIKRGETTIKRWIYDRGSQRFSMVVTIDDGRIESIETLD